MKPLVLGGTEFVGHALVEESLARGWEVTTFNRGSKPALEGVEAIVGDRRVGLDGLGHREWDIVADTWSWEPRVVRDSTRYLRDDTERYVFISTRSVYEHPTPALADESAPTIPGSMDDESGEDYATAKRGAELAVEAVFGDRAFMPRPGLILGPHENIGRLPWWLNRLAADGDILAPGPAHSTFQYVDARDLAAFALSDAAPGYYNVTNAPNTTTLGELLSIGMRVTGSNGTLRWADPDVLLAAGVQPWMQLPVWIPAGESHETVHEADVSKAMAAGLRIRPLEETVADTWTWLRSIGGVAPQRPDRPPLGLDPALERELLRSLES